MTTQSQIRAGAYYDSVVLMQLQSFLEQLEGIEQAGVAMGTVANLELLKEAGLEVSSAEIKSDDLVIIVKGNNDLAIEEAFKQVDNFLQRKRAVENSEYQPKSLESALKVLPNAKCVAISVAGRYAGDLAEQAIDQGQHVFLYSDNVSTAKEKQIKEKAFAKGLLVMGPDCGTATIQGVGLGFANKVRAGNIGLIAASGTGLQAVMSRIHQMGSGVSHAIGTGGRDLSQEIGGVSTIQSLCLLEKDPATEVIVLVSKPPSSQVVSRILTYLTGVSKPVVVAFLGYSPTITPPGVSFVSTLEEAAQKAVALSTTDKPLVTDEQLPSGQFLRGLFSGGTLAYEALLQLRPFVELHANMNLVDVKKLEGSQSIGHSIWDLGADEMTVGRLHPMMDQKVRLQKLRQEASDPDTAIILLDVVLGYGAHEDPCGEIVPVIREIQEQLTKENRCIEFVAVLVGTEDDPQSLSEQKNKLEQAGVYTTLSTDNAMQYLQVLLAKIALKQVPKVDRDWLEKPLAIINFGLDIFRESLEKQEVEVCQVDWKPPAGGSDKLQSLLKRLS